MTGPVLTHISNAAGELASSVIDAGLGSASVWHLEGRLTAGKSSALAETARLIAEQDRDSIPVLLAPPPRQLDTGPAALVDFGVGLSARAQLNGGLHKWVQERATWRDRLSDVRAWIAEHEDRVVLLCDEPTRWSDAPEETAFFAARTFDATRVLLEQTRCRRVIAGHVPRSLKRDHSFRLAPARMDRAWLEDEDAWGALAPAAAQVANAEVTIEELTPLEVRLLVALAALRGDRALPSSVNASSRRELPARLWDVVAKDPGLRRLKRMWLRLSFVRREFSSDLLDALSLNELSRRDAAVVKSSLVFGDESRLRLHEVLRSQARTWHREQLPQSREQVERHTGRALGAYYIERFAGAAVAHDASAVVDSMEAFHFVAFAADPELSSQVTPYFTEQLDALGWRLSYVYRQYDAAATVFQQAFEWDDEDDYAHHYFAFNLDRRGRSPRVVDAHYRRALELSPGNSWWHARYIAFLATRGRIGDAHIQWEEAQVSLGVAERASDRFLFETLHLWVADALLDRAELAFAREVLDEVPAWARSGEVLPAYPRLRRRLTALQQAAEGRALVPARRLVEQWWKRGPELLQERLGEGGGERLVRWLAARVEALDQDGVHLRAAPANNQDDSPPAVGEMIIDTETFLRLCRDPARAKRMEPGWHAEIGVYASEQKGDANRTVIRLLEPEVAEWADESPLPSSRYLRTTLSKH